MLRGVREREDAARLAPFNSAMRPMMNEFVVWLAGVDVLTSVTGIALGRGRHRSR